MEITTDIADDSSTRKLPILSLAALFGERFSIDWLQALSGERTSNVLAAIDEGIHHSILKQDRVGVYSFVDPRREGGTAGIVFRRAEGDAPPPGGGLYPV